MMNEKQTTEKLREILGKEYEWLLEKREPTPETMCLLVGALMEHIVSDREEIAGLRVALRDEQEANRRGQEVRNYNQRMERMRSIMEHPERVFPTQAGA